MMYEKEVLIKFCIRPGGILQVPDRAIFCLSIETLIESDAISPATQSDTFLLGVGLLLKQFFGKPFFWKTFILVSNNSSY